MTPWQKFHRADRPMNSERTHALPWRPEQTCAGPSGSGGGVGWGGGRGQGASSTGHAQSPGILTALLFKRVLLLGTKGSSAPLYARTKRYTAAELNYKGQCCFTFRKKFPETYSISLHRSLLPGGLMIQDASVHATYVPHVHLSVQTPQHIPLMSFRDETGLTLGSLK